MTDAPFQRILDSARTRLPGATTGAVQLELYNVLKEFCERTSAWHEAIPFTTQQNSHNYRISSHSPSALITRLLWVEGPRYGDGPIEHRLPGTRFAGSLETPGSTSTILRVAPLPGAGDVWHAHVALTITDPSGPTGLPQIPDWFIDKYYDALLNGVVSAMATQMAKPYSNPQHAQFHGRKFRDGMVKAKTEAQRNYQMGGQAWRYPGAFRTHTQAF